ncbi:MAG: hypothetical protein RR444_12280, partial [Oscillospiraceae bacterium]
LPIVVLLATLTGCSKDDDNKSIQLYYAIYDDKSDPVEGNRVSLLFPTSDKTQLIILGGDGDYAISNSDETVVNVTMESKHINITPLSTGSSTVKITDKSGGLYALNIDVLYQKLNLIIDKQDVIVIGDKLSEMQKAEIRQKAALTLPVKVNGGYSFIYNLDQHKGEVSIYKDKYGENGVLSTFEEKYTETAGKGYRSFAIQIDGKKREFILNRYVVPVSKSDMIVPVAFIEIITEQFKADYPDVESVYTQQRLINHK